MIADVGRIVARPAGARNRGQVQVIVESGDSDDLDRFRVEQLLAASKARPNSRRIVAIAAGLRIRPRIEQVEDYGREGGPSAGCLPRGR